MPTILLVRHGETHWNRIKRIQGHTDSLSPLTLRGIEQARAYGTCIRRLMGDQPGWRVVSSPLARCVQTTAILCETAGLDFNRTTFDDRLKEVDTGAFSGQLKSEVEARFPELMAGRGLDVWYLRCPGGEGWGDLATRLGDWLGELAAGDKVIAVSHGAAGKVVRALYGKLTPQEALTGDSPQDALYRLAGGRIQRVPTIPD
ncbi:MAG: histidine phosphatase family protein [Magnetospirillum sp.]|nr:histidine phosphatase family protein [Magnetospirillum sp.]